MTNLANPALQSSAINVINDYRPSFPKILKTLDDIAETTVGSDSFIKMNSTKRCNTFYSYIQLRDLFINLSSASEAEVLPLFQKFEFDCGDYKTVSEFVNYMSTTFKEFSDCQEQKTFELVEVYNLMINKLLKKLYKLIK